MFYGKQWILHIILSDGNNYYRGNLIWESIKKFEFDKISYHKTSYVQAEIDQKESPLIITFYNTKFKLI